ncbi:hypothetical protein BV20DRAFT_720075 [Pilatotrama ljubarskyi]|nr:hypothetical protein BV20DRAFT_720075 [Pilatotrama ljubarskyi]
MDRQGRGPPQRHSSLPVSLHRLLVSGPPQPPQSPNADDTTTLALAPQTGVEGGRVSPGGIVTSASVQPAPGAEQQLPSLVLTEAAFQGVPGVQPAGARQQTRSPASGNVGQETGPAAVPTLPALPLPPPPPQHVLRTDPALYASSSSLPSTYTAARSGPHLRPISWSSGSAVSAPPTAARLGSPDRSAPPLARTLPQPRPIAGPPHIPVSPPSPPVAGPSRLPEEPAPTRGRKRKTAAKKAQPALLSAETSSASRSTSRTRRRRDASGAELDFGRSAGAPAAVPPPAGGEASQRTARPSASTRRAEAGPSARRISESGRGSPASSTTENYPVAVGATAYSVTTLSPLRATILPPVLEPDPPPEGPTVESVPPGMSAAGAGPSTSRGGVGERAAEVKRSESDTEEAEAEGRGKRRRRGRSSRQESSTTSSSSEHAQAPKSKKTLIACHFCRARKLRCDGQKPSCANCRKRSHPCTYEQQPKRRGPGKTPRGSSSRRRTRSSAAGSSAADPTRTAEASGSGAGTGPSAAGAPPAPEAAGAFNAEAAAARRAAAEAALAAATAARAQQQQRYPEPPASPPSIAFEPQLTGPVPTYPGFAYRPPSASSSSFSATGQLPPFHFYSVGRGMNRSVASDSVRSSNTSNVSSAPSVPDSEEGVEGSVVDEFMDYTELEEFYLQPQPGPGPGEEGSQ